MLSGSLPAWRLSALFEEALEGAVAERGPLRRLTTYQGDQRCADAVTLKVEGEGHTRPGAVVEWFDLDRRVLTVTAKGTILDIDIVADPHRLARLGPATEQPA